jgi:hypothetical protein
MPPVVPSPFAPSPYPPDPEMKLCRASHLNFAAASITADLMSYVGAEPSGNGRDAIFTLTDPGDQYEDLLRRWNAGVFPKINPRIFLEVRNYLLQESQRVHRAAVKREK